jgi:crotonobetainyl-CoA:carnitine CoA-transferase CaiB-like acyl-CoA transferase
MRGILDGVKVLGLEQQVAGPTCTMMLADQGAEIIKVERPGNGDTAREMAPLLKNDKGEVQSGYFARFNRSKKSLTLDMQSPEGQKVLWDLIKKVDIVIENLKPGLMDKLGFTCEKVREANPSLVYVAISGFGRSKKYEGSYAKRLAYDIIAQAMAGQMHTCGNDADGPPTWLGFALGDAGTGVYAAYSAMLGYINKLKTGKGEYMDVAMYDCMIALAERSHNIYAFTGNVVNRGPDKLIAPWGSFACKDGYVALIVPTEAMWKKFLTAIGHIELLDNPDIQSGPGRSANMETLIRPIINDWMKDKTKIEVCDLLMAQGLPCGPIQTSEEVAHCPHIAKRDLLVKIPDPIVGELTMVGNPIKMEEHETEYRPLPNLGADTDAVLSEIGYGADKIKHLRESKAI